MDNLLSVEKAAEVLSISPWTVRAWIAKGRLGSTKLGSRRLIPQSEIEKLIANGTAITTGANSHRNECKRVAG